MTTTDYGHTKAKSLILCGPNSNPIPNKHLGCGYKGLVFCRNNGLIMENMDKGLTVPKGMGAGLCPLGFHSASRLYVAYKPPELQEKLCFHKH